MAQWGLPRELWTTAPWGLPEEMLRPGKVITDPVHKDIHLSQLEVRFLNSGPLQRLRRVRQLGNSNLVYSGASHSRLAHSLGALHAAQRIMTAAVSQRSAPHPSRDLFDEWMAEDERGTTQYPYKRRLAEALVLARLGGLLHDMCHVPFGHTLEDDLGLLDAHDDNLARFERLWSELPDDLQNLAAAGGLKEALEPLILSKADHIEDLEKVELPPFDERPPALRYPFIRDVVGNTICADLIDYLNRDYLMSGLPASLGHRFLDGFYVAPSDVWCRERLVMRIERGGRERSDIVTELFKYLRYRYEETERILVHHAKLSADAMIGKLLEMWSDELWIQAAINEGESVTDIEQRDVDALRNRILDTQPELAQRLDDLVKGDLEDLVLTRGDDGMLEHVLYLHAERANTRQDAIHALTKRVLDRDLYKLLGRARMTAGMERDQLWDRYGTPEERRRIERAVARFAGLNEGWEILLWLPHPAMRLKLADVLVTSDGRHVSKLSAHPTHKKQGEEIVDSHRELWAVSVYAPAPVRDDAELTAAILSKVGQELGGLDWERSDLSLATPEDVAAIFLTKRRPIAGDDVEKIAERIKVDVAARSKQAESSTSLSDVARSRTYHEIRSLAEAAADSIDLGRPTSASFVDETVDLDAGPTLFEGQGNE